MKKFLKFLLFLAVFSACYFKPLKCSPSVALMDGGMVFSLSFGNSYDKADYPTDGDYVNFLVREIGIIGAKYYKLPIDRKKLYYGALKGMADALDPHSRFLDPAEREKSRKLDKDKEIDGGVGIYIGLKEGHIVLSPIEDSPAEKAGIKEGDILCAIGNLDVTGVTQKGSSFSRVVGLIGGKNGEKIDLSVSRKGEARLITITVVRGRVSFKSVKWKMLEGSIALVRISQFNCDVRKNFAEVAADVSKSGAKGLILDLRNNPGGLLDSAAEIAGHWIGNRLFETLRYNDGSVEKVMSKGRATLKDFKTVILINGDSASAAEALAVVLQDYGKAKIIGTRTYGKGTAQQNYDFADGSALHLTVARWYSPKGKCVDGRGLIPDIEVKKDEDIIETAKLLLEKK